MPWLRLAAIAIVVLIVYVLYERGRPRRRAVHRGDDAWAPLQTSLRGPEELEPLAQHLREHRIGTRLKTEPGPGDHSLSKLLVQRKDLTRARELAARFELQVEHVIH